VNEWVNVRQNVKRFGGHWVFESATVNAVHFQFTAPSLSRGSNSDKHLLGHSKMFIVIHEISMSMKCYSKECCCNVSIFRSSEGSVHLYSA